MLHYSRGSSSALSHSARGVRRRGQSQALEGLDHAFRRDTAGVGAAGASAYKNRSAIGRSEETVSFIIPR